MKLKWLHKILVELTQYHATCHGNLLVVCAFFMFTNGWMNGASLTGTPQGCEHENTVSLHGFVDNITVKPPLNFNFLFLNQQMHAIV